MPQFSIPYMSDWSGADVAISHAFSHPSLRWPKSRGSVTARRSPQMQQVFVCHVAMPHSLRPHLSPQGEHIHAG